MPRPLKGCAWPIARCGGRSSRGHRRPQRAHHRSLAADPDTIAKQQIDTLRRNCQEFGIRYYDLDSQDQGIVHVIGPELGLTQPGMTIVCGDSHTATHGALGALAFGIGTSEVEHVLATQTLLQHRPKTMEVRLDGRLARASRPRTSSCGSLAASLPAAARATASSTPARRSGNFRWKSG